MQSPEGLKDSPFKCSFFQTNKTFFQEQKNFVQGTTFVQFFMYWKAKTNFGVIRKILEFFFSKSVKLIFKNIFLQKFLYHSEICFCLTIRKKLNKS